MNLGELLQHIADDVLDDRADLVDGAPDSVWTEELIVRYLNAAQNEFARKTFSLVDNTTAACCQIALVTEQAEYALHSSILRVLSVTPADTDVDLARVNYGQIRTQVYTGNMDYWDANIQYVDQPGRPRWYATDVATKKIRLRPAPRAEDVAAIVDLNLRVARLPLTPLSATDLSGTPEIEEQYHIGLCDYVYWRCLNHPNVDAKARPEARDFKKNWDATIREARNAFILENASAPSWRYGGWAN